MMLHSFRIMFRNLVWNSQSLQKAENCFVPAARVFCHLPALLGQEDAAIRFAGDIAFLDQSPDRLGDGDWADAEPCGQVHGPRFARLLDQG